MLVILIFFNCPVKMDNLTTFMFCTIASIQLCLKVAYLVLSVVFIAGGF